MTRRQDILLEQDGPIARLTLNRPDRRNALNEIMWETLPELLADAEAKCRLLVLTGAGDAFSAGADISEFEDIYSDPERGVANSRRIAEALDALARFPLPTIARIRGACIGGGCGLALACDIRISDDTANFAITPAKMGLIYPFNDTKRLMDIAGPATAKDMLLSARKLDAREALSTRLIHACVPSSEIEAAVDAYCDHLLTLSPASHTGIKEMMRRIENGQSSDNDETRRLFEAAFESADFNEGYRAFLEKRKPSFK